MENSMPISNQEKCCILIFAKYPEAGMVKTRIAETMGFQKAAELYKCMVLDTIEFVRHTNFPHKILFWPGEFAEQMPSVFGKEHVYAPQVGNDLSQRLANGFSMGFKQDFEYIVAIGSDSPDMPLDVIVSAFTILKSNDAVIGPTADGGYYLIGFSQRSFNEMVFKSILWSTPEVLSQTLKILKDHKKTVSLLKPWYDLDTSQDLQWFTLRYRSGPCSANRTLSFILHQLTVFKDAPRRTQ